MIFVPSAREGGGNSFRFTIIHRLGREDRSVYLYEQKRCYHDHCP